MELAGAAPGIDARTLSSRSVAVPQCTYRPDIDGLRAFAILSVVLHHAGLPFLTGGFTGVDIFFVISGYLIGGQIFAELRSGKFVYLRFYQRRAKRILPAFFAVVAFTLATGLALLSPADMAKLARSAFAATLSSANILFWHGANYFDARNELNPMLMTWSLGAEEQFYAVIPLLLALLVRMRRKSSLSVILIFSVLSFSFAWAALVRDPAFAFYMLPARAWELGIGVALSIAELDIHRKGLAPRLCQLASPAGLALMLVPLFLLTRESPFPAPAALPSVLGAALCIAAPATWLNRRLLSFVPLVFIGRISYSWYLWHWPLLSFLHILCGSQPPRILSLLSIAASFVLAALSYRYIEQPFRRSPRAPAPLLRRYAAAAGAALAVCAVIWLSRGVPQRFPSLGRLEQERAVIASDPCLADEGISRPNVSTNCIQGSARPQVVAIWGDSHAAALAPALRSLANAQGYGFIEMAKASCPPVVGAAHFIPRHPQLAAECFQYGSGVFGQIRQNPRIRVVILSAAWAGYLHRNWQDGWMVGPQNDRMPPPGAARDLLANSLAESIRSLIASGKRVILFNEVPAFGFEPMARICAARIPARRVLAAWFGVKSADDTGTAWPQNSADAASISSLLRSVAASEQGVELVDPGAQLCDAAGECAYRIGDRLLYLDNNHLTPAGAQYALRSFRLPTIELTAAGGGREP